MIADKLNIIESFISDPKPGLRNLHGVNVLDGGIFEEFFLRGASGNNSSSVFDVLLTDCPKYFINIIDDFFEDKGNIEISFNSFFFIYRVAKDKRTKGKDFKEILKIVNHFIEKSSQSPIKNLNIYYYIADVICEFPLDSITDDHLDYISAKAYVESSSLVATSVERTLIPRIIEENKLELGIKVISTVLLSYFIIEKTDKFFDSIPRIQGRFEPYVLSDIITSQEVIKLSEMIGQGSLVKILTDKINEINDTSPFEFTSFNISTIEDSDQIMNIHSFPFLLVKFTRIVALCQIPDKAIVTNLIKNKAIILQRIGIHVIGQSYSSNKDSFWKWPYGNPLEASELKHEIYELLRINVKSLEEDDVIKLLKWIDEIKVKPWTDGLTKKDLDQNRAIRGKEFLAALSEIDSSLKKIVDDKFKELDEITTYTYDHPGYNSYISFSSPDARGSDELNQSVKNSQDLYEYINGKIAALDQFGRSERIYGLQDFISNNFEVISDFKLVSQLDFIFLESIIWGIEKRWNESKNIDWGIVFGLIESVNYEVKDTKIDERNSFIGSCCWLIRSATQDDSRKIEHEYLIRSKNLCLNFIGLNIETEQKGEDIFTSILNSPEGKIFDAMLNVLLSNARQLEKGIKDRWFSDVKELYTSILTSKRYNKAFIHSITRHLSQYGYLDINWIKENINFLFPKDNEAIWKLAMRSYSRFTQTLYKGVFSILLTEGHYHYGIKVLKGEETGIPEFINQCVLANIARWEGQKLNDPDSLIRVILDTGDRSQCIAVIDYLYTFRDIDQEKLYELWSAIFTEAKLSEFDKKDIYQKSLKLIGKVTELDDNYYNLIEQIFSKIPDKKENYDFIRNITKSTESDVVNRARLLINGTSDNLIQHYHSDRFSKITLALYAKDRDFADVFVDNMLQKRLFNLLPLYNEQHRKN